MLLIRILKGHGGVADGLTVIQSKDGIGYPYQHQYHEAPRMWLYGKRKNLPVVNFCHPTYPQFNKFFLSSLESFPNKHVYWLKSKYKWVDNSKLGEAKRLFLQDTAPVAKVKQAEGARKEDEGDPEIWATIKKVNSSFMSSLPGRIKVSFCTHVTFVLSIFPSTFYIHFDSNLSTLAMSLSFEGILLAKEIAHCSHFSWNRKWNWSFFYI